jgi:molybdate/tungstate transport system substrate-binding protein
MSRRMGLALLVVVLGILSGHFTSTRAAGGTVDVVYAGSLVNLNEKVIGPTFQTLTGYTYQGQGLGSLAIVNEIKSHIITPDVIELADPAANTLLMGTDNGNYVKWYITYARSELVIGYDPASKFAPLFNRVRHHKLPWYKPLLAHGLRLGRTDPELDPKGYRTLFMFRLAQRLYHLKNFVHRVLGSDRNPTQTFPEEVLVARLLAGQIDAGIFYLSEVKDLDIPYITLPPQINLGSPKYVKLYATQRYTNKEGKTFVGSPILYTITIPSTVKNLNGAVAFVKFVLGKRARLLSAAHGLLPTRVVTSGDVAAVPPGIEAVVKARA